MPPDMADPVSLANVLLATHRELRSLACVKSGYRYDAKLVLAAAAALTLRIYGLDRICGDALPYCGGGLAIRDVRSEQHDRICYEITDQDGDLVLLRCERLVLTHCGARILLS